MSDLKNFGMIIPTTAFDPYHKPDPNGVPIYDKCQSEGWCACTGKCRKIIGYNTDPECVKAYHEQIEKINTLLRNRFQGIVTLNADGTTRTWELKQ